MGAYAQDTYQEYEILSADGIGLVRILYRAALESVDRARGCLRQGDIEGRSRAISKAISIVIELSGSLDRERGGELSRSLVELYDYVQRLLIDANLRQADEPLEETAKLLGALLEGWMNCHPAGEPHAAHAPAPSRPHAEEPECVGQAWSL